MRVKLTRDWFAPNSSLYVKGEHQLPDDWEHVLPSSATLLPDLEPEAVTGPKKK